MFYPVFYFFYVAHSFSFIVCLMRLEFIIFVYFDQIVSFQWQPSTLLQNYIQLRQSAAQLLLFVQKSKMAAAIIKNLPKNKWCLAFFQSCLVLCLRAAVKSGYWTNSRC